VNHTTENDLNVWAKTSTRIIEHSVGGSLMIQISLPQQQQAYLQHHRTFKYKCDQVLKNIFNTTAAVDHALLKHAAKYLNDVTIPKLGFHSHTLSIIFLIFNDRKMPERVSINRWRTLKAEIHPDSSSSVRMIDAERRNSSRSFQAENSEVRTHCTSFILSLWKRFSVLHQLLKSFFLKHFSM
jgi:hypothetical protein